MSPTPSPPSDRDPLRTLLDEAESELRQRLEEACEAEAKGVSTESTAAVRQLEDNLLAAASAAKQTIAIRDQMQRRTRLERGPVRLDVADKPDDTAEMGVREFTDDDGRPWRAWSVVPGLSRASSQGGQFLGDFQNGWICFESIGSSQRRRLPFPRSRWPNVTDDELRELLLRAIDAPIRQKKSAGGS